MYDTSAQNASESARLAVEKADYDSAVAKINRLADELAQDSDKRFPGSYR